MAIERNELLIHLTTLMDLKGMMLEECECGYKETAKGNLLVMRRFCTLTMVLVMQIHTCAKNAHTYMYIQVSA